MLIYVKRFLDKIRIYLIKNLADALYKNSKIVSNKIIVDNFIGKGYGDNPKYICDKLLEMNGDLDIVWVVKKDDDSFPQRIRKVKYGSLKSLKEYYSAKIWIDNVRNSLKPLRKKDTQFYLQTWHGLLPFKYIEGQIDHLDFDYERSVKRDSALCNAIISSNSALTSIMERYFWIDDKSKILSIGSPESDLYFQNDIRTIANKKIRGYYNIAPDNLIVLYMPTFRDDMNMDVFSLDYIKLCDAIEKKQNCNCSFLVRLHPNIKNQIKVPEDKRIINVSDYPDATELLSSMDWLISDYSSIIYVPILLYKPSILYIPDVEEYRRKRGLNECFDTLPCPNAHSMEELIETISTFEIDEYIRGCEEYNNSVIAYNVGKSSEKVAEMIMNEMNTDNL